MTNFQKQKKYYTKSEVEKYVQDLLGKSEIIVLEQKDKIFNLSLENGKLNKVIDDQNKREKNLSKALTDTTKNLADIIETEKQQAIDNASILRKFISKWQILFEEGYSNGKAHDFEQEMETIIEQISKDNLEKEVAHCTNLNNAKQVSKDLKITTKTSKEDLDKRYEMVLKKYEEQKKKQESGLFKESSFNIDEALNPTIALTEIMQEIFSKKSK